MFILQAEFVLTYLHHINMSNATDQLVAVRSAFASVNKGSEVNEESWMTCRSFVCPPISLTQRYSQWCTTNWGELLQPGPLSLSLLDSILIVASSTNDFSRRSTVSRDFLIVSYSNLGLDRNGAPPFIWKFAQHPDSFQRGLQQMVSVGIYGHESAQLRFGCRPMKDSMYISFSRLHAAARPFS